MGVNFINKYQNWVISKSGKSHIKILKFEAENLKWKICIQIPVLVSALPKMAFLHL